MNQSQFPNTSEYRNACLANLNLDDAKMQQFSNWVSKPHDMLLYLGSPGCGKTYFCAALVNYLNDAKKQNMFLFERDFLHGLRECISKGWDYNYELEKLMNMPFVILDDMGSSQMTDWQKEALFIFVDNRMMSRLPTVITSNNYLKDIKSKFEPRFYSRLCSARNTIIELKDEDLRQVYK